MAILQLHVAADVSEGRFLQRVTVDGVSKVQHATQKTRAGGQIHVGVSGTSRAATSTKMVGIATPGEVKLMECGAAIAASDYILTTDGQGRVVPGFVQDTDRGLALNVLGQTTDAAGEWIKVLVNYIP